MLLKLKSSVSALFQAIGNKTQEDFINVTFVPDDCHLLSALNLVSFHIKKIKELLLELLITFHKTKAMHNTYQQYLQLMFFRDLKAKNIIFKDDVKIIFGANIS